jgi:hypothetical protein
MTVAQSPEPSLRAGSGAWRALELLGLVAAVLSSALFLALIAFVVLPPANSQNQPAWPWLERTTGISDNGAAAVAVGLPLVLCLIGLIIGIVGWVRTSHRRAPARMPKLTVLLTLTGPIAVVIFYVVGLFVYISSSGGVPN